MDTNFWGFSLANYTTQFKLDLIQRYEGGNVGCKSLAKQFDLSDGQLRRWINLYRAHGAAGLEKKSASYSAKQKLAILQYRWDNELSYGQTAAVFNIRSPGHLSKWEHCYHSGGINALQPRRRGVPKRMADPKPVPPQPPVGDEARSREELLAEVNFLRMENAYLKKLKALVQEQRDQRTTARKKRK